jgi:hypothetical protein
MGAVEFFVVPFSADQGDFFRAIVPMLRQNAVEALDSDGKALNLREGVRWWSAGSIIVIVAAEVPTRELVGIQVWTRPHKIISTGQSESLLYALYVGVPSDARRTRSLRVAYARRFVQFGVSTIREMGAMRWYTQVGPGRARQALWLKHALGWEVQFIGIGARAAPPAPAAIDDGLPPEVESWMAA